jgi:hypothetical protein
MEHTKKRKFIIWSVVLMLLLAVGGTAVFAQSQDNPEVTPPAEGGDTESVTPDTPANPFGRDGRPDWGGHADRTSTDEYLAEALGITSEDLQAAQEAARAAALEQAVADGLLTQEQADQLSQHDGRFMRGGHFGALGDMDELLAEALGISVEELQAAREAANAAKLAQMVEDGYLTQEQADLIAARRAVQSHMDYEGLQAAAQAAYETAVQAALDAGKITQEQAAQLLSDAAAAPGFGQFNFGGHGGRPGGRGHGGHGGHDFPGASSTTTTTADSNA